MQDRKLTFENSRHRRRRMLALQTTTITSTPTRTLHLTALGLAQTIMRRTTSTHQATSTL